MKNFCIILIVLTLGTKSFAQIQKIKAGFIFVPQVDLSSGDFTKMKVYTPLLSNINFITKKTYHNICYVWEKNKLVVVNGWMYNSKQDIYLVLTKNLSTSGGNVMIAWEQELTDGPISSYIAIEIGTPWDTFNRLLVNLSLTIPFDITIWGEKWCLERIRSFFCFRNSIANSP